MPLRLAAGAMAGMTATALTHPLDVMRLRLALPQSPVHRWVTRQGRLDIDHATAQSECMTTLVRL